MTDTFGLDDNVLVSIRYGTIRSGDPVLMRHADPVLVWANRTTGLVVRDAESGCLRRQAPLESVKAHPFKFDKTLEEISGPV